MKCLNGLFLPALLPAAMALASGGAFAQGEEFALEEIVVTAKKRSESIQDVGIAMSAFGGEQLKELGLQSLSDVTDAVPNVELYDEYGAGQPTWVIRGVGLQDFNANNTPASAIYIDEIYQASNVMGGAALFDIERIEVLKGPQGGLYGRNTSGGAVQVVSTRPNLDVTEGYLNLSYGRWDDVTVEAAANTYLSDSAALRVAGQWQQSDDSWQTSLVDGKAHGEKDKWALRAQLLLQPSDQLEVLLKVHGGEDNSETVMGRSIGAYDPITGGFCASMLAGQRDDSSCLDLTNLAVLTLGGTPVFPNVQSDNGSRTLANPINQLDNSFSGASALVTLDWESVTLTSVTGYDQFDYGLTFDYDGSSQEFGHQVAATDIEVWSQEFRLASNNNSAFSWMLGIAYAEDEVKEDRAFLFRDNAFMTLLGGFAGTIALGYNQETESLATYGQVGYEFNEQWRVNASLRYTDEEKHYRDGSSTAAPFVGFSGVDSDFDMDVVSGKLGLEWTPDNDTLIYANLSRGFKTGGFYGGVLTASVEEVAPYEEETVWAYELGFKSEWLDNTLRVNGAAFFYDYRDVQGFQTVFSPLVGGPITKLGNLGDAEHQGAELDVTWLVAEGLTLEAGVAYLEAEISDSDEIGLSQEGIAAPPWRDWIAVTPPRWSGNLRARYETPISNQLQAAFMVDYSYRDDFTSGMVISELDEALYGIDGYGLLGARATLESSDGRWALSLWGKNLGDKEYVTNTTTDDLGSFFDIMGQPRSYGVDLTLSW